jgi:hypothetical protein
MNEHQEFKNRLNEISEKIAVFIAKENTVKSIEEIVWIEGEHNFLKESLEKLLLSPLIGKNDDFYKCFGFRAIHRYDQYKLIEAKKAIFGEANRIYSNLNHYKNIIDHSDIFSKPDIDISERENYNTDEIIKLLFIKLHSLYDGKYYSIPYIFNVNGIKMKFPFQDREYGKAIAENDYAELLHQPDTTAKLTLKGKMYVERNLLNTNGKTSDQSQIDLESKIIEIMKKLETLGLGQEVIYVELEELKDLHEKLNEKNWIQIVKGKLVELSVEKAIDMATIKYIFETLTNTKLEKLLG